MGLPDGGDQAPAGLGKWRFRVGDDDYQFGPAGNGYDAKSSPGLGFRSIGAEKRAICRSKSGWKAPVPWRLQGLVGCPNWYVGNAAYSFVAVASYMLTAQNKSLQCATNETRKGIPRRCAGEAVDEQCPMKRLTGSTSWRQDSSRGVAGWCLMYSVSRRIEGAPHPPQMAQGRRSF